MLSIFINSCVKSSKIGKSSEIIIIKVNPFIYKYKVRGISFPLETKMIGKNLRKTIYQFLLMFCMLKKKNMYPAYVLKQNSNRQKQV